MSSDPAQPSPRLTDAVGRIVAHPRVAGVAPDAALEAMARAFLARWPALEALPEEAPVAFVDVLRRKDRRTVARWCGDPLLTKGLVLLDAELEGIAAGSRRGALRETVPAADVPALVACLRAMGFAAAPIAPQGAHGATRSGRLERADDHAIVGVAADEESLAALAEAQRSLRGATGAAVAEAAGRVGALLGYPPCCAEAFRALPDQGDNRLLELYPYLRSTGLVHPLLVRFGAGSLVSAHFPCRCDCAASAAAAERALAHADAAAPGLGAAVLRELSRPVLSVAFGDHIVLAGAWQGDAFTVTAADALEGDRARLRAGAIVRLTPDAVVVCDDEGEAAFPALHPLLVVPGEPLAAAARAVLPPPPAAPPAPGPPLPRLLVGVTLPAPLPAPAPPGWALAALRTDTTRPDHAWAPLRSATAELVVVIRPAGADRCFLTAGPLALSYQPPATPLPPNTIEALVRALAALLTT